jgi:hypothetical protein
MVEKNLHNTVTSKPEQSSTKAGNKFLVFMGLRGSNAEQRIQISPTIKPDEKEPNHHLRNSKISKEDIERYNSLMKDKKYLDAAYLALANGLGSGRTKRAANRVHGQYMESKEFLKAFLLSKELSLSPKKREQAKFNAFVRYLETGEFYTASIFAGTSQLSKEKILEGITPILNEHKREANHEAVLELALRFNVTVPDDILSLLENTKRE